MTAEAAEPKRRAAVSVRTLYGTSLGTGGQHLLAEDVCVTRVLGEFA